MIIWIKHSSILFTSATIFGRSVWHRAILISQTVGIIRDGIISIQFARGKRYCCLVFVQILNIIIIIIIISIIIIIIKFVLMHIVINICSFFDLRLIMMGLQWQFSLRIMSFNKLLHIFSCLMCI